MRFTHFIFPLFFLFLFLHTSSCREEKSEKNNSTTASVSPEKKAISKPDKPFAEYALQDWKIYIKNIEDTLYKSKELNGELGRIAIDAYTTCAEKYFKDSLAPFYLYKAAEIASHMGFPQKAIDLYRLCYERYMNFPMRPECRFQMANIYNFQLHDYPNAKMYYNDVVMQYPKHPLAKDADQLILHLGKSDEQLIREFEEKNGIKKENKK